MDQSAKNTRLLTLLSRAEELPNEGVKQFAKHALLKCLQIGVIDRVVEIEPLTKPRIKKWLEWEKAEGVRLDLEIAKFPVKSLDNA
jgi:hypothetical protein